MSVVQPITAPRIHIRTEFVFVLALAVTVIAFRDSLALLVGRWMAQEEYSHGFLIPVVSAWLLWMRRDAIAANIGRPSWTGLAIILFAFAIHIIGQFSSIFLLSQLAFILVLFGLVMAFGGYALLQVTFVPIAFLIFAIPLPYFLEAKLTLQLQLISSQLGTAVIRMFQIPVYLEGNLIDLGYYKLSVVEACSGLRYLYPLLSLSFLAAYLFQAPIWQRAFVFLSGIPITIGMNGFRIGMVGVTMDRWGTQMADGFLHFFEGWIIFIACAVILLAEMAVLARLSGHKLFHVFGVSASAGNALATRTTDESGGNQFARQFVAVTCLVLLCAGALAIQTISHRTELVPERTRFAAFPRSIDDWRGHASLLEPATEKALGVDDYILSDYVRSDGKPVNLYVAYYSTQRNGYAPHSPAVCLPGGGWFITHLEQTNYDGLGIRFPLNRAIIEHDGTRDLVYYWFDERGRKIAGEYAAKWYLLTDAITKNRTDGALIRLTTRILPEEAEHDADRRLQAFMRAAVPTLSAFLPRGDAGEPGDASTASTNSNG
jgi:exosortase D (VPLPA-CTERM-specific)